MASGAKEPLCKAFNEAAEEWCAQYKKHKKSPKEHPPPGKFNDRFYQKLNAQTPAPGFLSKMEREVPGLFKVGGGGLAGATRSSGVIGRVADGANSLARKTARAMMTRMGNIARSYKAVQGPMGGLLVTAAGSAGDADKSFYRLNEYFRARLSKQFYPRYYDGVLPGKPPRVVEIKGPTDSFKGKHGKGQARDLNSLKPKPAVLSCKSCDSPHCETTPSGGQRCK